MVKDWNTSASLTESNAILRRRRGGVERHKTEAETREIYPRSVR